VKFKKLVFIIFLTLSSQSFALLEVKITKKIESVEVTHNGENVVVQRIQDKSNKVDSDYLKTSRKCPPYCIQPAKLAPGVETIAEIEILKYLEKKNRDESILEKKNRNESIIVIDVRSEAMAKKSTIPGSINIPWIHLDLNTGGNILNIMESLTTKFGVKENDGLLSFHDAKVLILFCNGSWSGQSGDFIKTLLNLGYPAHKLKWYRGGIQAWQSFGLTIIK